MSAFLEKWFGRREEQQPTPIRSFTNQIDAMLSGHRLVSINHPPSQPMFNEPVE